MSEEKINQPNQQIEEIKKEVVVILDYCDGLAINNQEDMVHATDVLKRIVSKKKEFEGARKALVQPLNDHVKNINLMFKGSIAPLVEVEEKVKNGMLEYRRIEAVEIAKKQQEEAERQKKEFEKQQTERLKEVNSRKEKKEIKQEEFEVDTSEIKQDSVVKSENGSVRVKKVWNFKVISEMFVPEEYKIIDERLIRKAIKDGIREISGVEIFQEEQIGTYAK